MKRVWPHEFFRLDFDQMLEVGRHQERIHTANTGEYNTVKNIHTYFASEVLPSILSEDWVFEAAITFVSDYATDCFHLLRLSGQEAYNAQKSLMALKTKSGGFLGACQSC